MTQTNRSGAANREVKAFYTPERRYFLNGEPPTPSTYNTEIRQKRDARYHV